MSSQCVEYLGALSFAPINDVMEHLLFVCSLSQPELEVKAH
jgi:hypothetical protein